MLAIFQWYRRRGHSFPQNFQALLRRFKCQTCVLSKNAHEYQVSQRVLAQRRLSSPRADLETISPSSAGAQCTGADSGEPVPKAVHTGKQYTGAHSGELMLKTVHSRTFSGDNIAVTSPEEMYTGTHSEEIPPSPNASARFAINDLVLVYDQTTRQAGVVTNFSSPFLVTVRFDDDS